MFLGRTEWYGQDKRSLPPLPTGPRKFLLFFTGLSEKDGPLQRIGVAVSSDGHHFEDPKLLLSPTTELGYDPTADDGIIMAWRDPSLLQDPRTGSWHMVFGAKHRTPEGVVKPAVGHAVARGDDLMEWELLPPITLPVHFDQVEVPQLIHRKGEYYLFVSTVEDYATYRENGTTKGLNVFVAADLDGEWTPVDGERGKIQGDQRYATTLFEDPPHSGEYRAVAFYSEGYAHALTATPILSMKWEGRVPRLEAAPEEV
jgi:hypothetical protein